MAKIDDYFVLDKKGFERQEAFIQNVKKNSKSFDEFVNELQQHFKITDISTLKKIYWEDKK